MRQKNNEIVPASGTVCLLEIKQCEKTRLKNIENVNITMNDIGPNEKTKEINNNKSPKPNDSKNFLFNIIFE